MAESLAYPHIDLENCSFLQLNATTSSNMQTQFNNEHRAGAWIRDGGSATRSASVVFHSQTGKYRCTEKNDNGATVSMNWADYSTLSGACDDAAAFVDSENTAS